MMSEPSQQRAPLKMSGTQIVLTPDGTETITHLDEPPTAESLHKIVGGFIELVPSFFSISCDGAVRKCVAFCNEDGIRDELPVNNIASGLWLAALYRANKGSAPQLRYPTILRGNVVVLYGDAKFMNAL